MDYLNIGCGAEPRNDCVNIDINPKWIPDMVMDATKMPWIWSDKAMDGIYMYHFLEHTPNPREILAECHRILKVGGFLHITAPHSTSASGNGCLGHYRTFSYNSLKDYLSIQNNMFATINQRIIYLPHYEWLPVQCLIDLSPIFFERFWGYWVGGATEVEWYGKKL